MRRHLIAVCLCATALTISACDYIGGDSGATPSALSTTEGAASLTTSKNLLPPENTRSVSVPSGIAPAVLRRETCEKFSERFETIRRDSGQAGVDRAVADALADFPGTPDWQVFTEEQRQASLDGARDAGTGKCE
ncbi:hypothetical protein [Nocardia sp. NPDC005978]|uniref:hypothetical protein n=1 Tax=unclassified Nocardia TaxID=2637762 RepID=UPI0033B1A01A